MEPNNVMGRGNSGKSFQPVGTLCLPCSRYGGKGGRLKPENLGKSEKRERQYVVPMGVMGVREEGGSAPLPLPEQITRRSTFEAGAAQQRR